MRYFLQIEMPKKLIISMQLRAVVVLGCAGITTLTYANSAVQDKSLIPLPLEKVNQLAEAKEGHDIKSPANRQNLNRQDAETGSKEETRSTQAAPSLPEITVPGLMDPNSPYNTRYIRSSSSTATKTNTPVMETPFSIQVIPRQVMQDRQSFRLQDALQNVSGVTFFPNSISNQDASIIRGFETNAFYRNGVFVPDNFFVEMANVEQVEVLKGPGSILFGRADPGGIINLVTKRPLGTPYYSVQQQAGSFDFYRTAVDASGPLTKDGSLLYRINLSYENSRSFRDFAYRKSVFFSPSFTWNISPRTQVTAEMEYQAFNNSNDGGLVALGDRPAPLPRSTSLDEPVFNKNKGDRVFGGINWSHQFNENWKIMNWLSIHHTDVSQNKQIVPFSAAESIGTIDRPFGTVDRFQSSAPYGSTRYQSMLNLVGNVTTGKLQHTLLFGYDYFHNADGNTRAAMCCPLDTINIFNHTYLTEPPVFPADPEFSQFSKASQSWHGAYFQDQVKLPFNLHLLGGFRYDNATTRDTVANQTTGKDDRFSPRGGLLWRPLEWLSLYGSYTENFGVSNGFDVNRKKLPPQSAQQWELGFKTEFLDGRLRSTFAYFELTKQNIAIRDPANPFFFKPVGEAETRGIEFDVSGEVLPGWNMIATYSYLPFARITKDNSAIFDDESNAIGVSRGNQGNRLFLAAEHTGSYWNTYEFRTGMLRGLRIGGGIQGIGQRQGDAENTFQLPAFVIGNLMTSYQTKLMHKMYLTVQLNVNNVSNENYSAGSAGPWFITPGAPRIFLGSLRLDY